MQSFQLTPSIQAIGANTIPKMRSRVGGSQPIAGRVCAQPRKPFTIAISAMKAISMAPMFNARCRPSPAPRAAASIRFTPGFSTCTSTLPAVSGLSTSGISILASMMVAGAVIITAVSRCLISTLATMT